MASTAAQLRALSMLRDADPDMTVERAVEIVGKAVDLHPDVSVVMLRGHVPDDVAARVARELSDGRA